MEKLKAIAVAVFILFSLFPVYLLVRYLQKVMRPGQSPGLLLAYIFTVFLLIFIYTFLAALLVRLVFRVA